MWVLFLLLSVGNYDIYIEFYQNLYITSVTSDFVFVCSYFYIFFKNILKSLHIKYYYI
jgi:hypothetical protein